MKKIVWLLPLLFLLTACAKSGSDLDHYKNYTAKQIFDGGEHLLAKGEYADAVKHFEALDALYPFGPYAQQGQLDSIYAYYEKKDDAEAIAAADRYIRLYPRGPHADYAYYMKGLISYRQGFTWLQRSLGVDPAPRDLTDKRQSFLAFSQVVNFFPNSPYAQDSALRMHYIRNVIARHNLEIARFYYKRKAYVASANRAAFVVQHFEGAPAVVPALAVMVKSYRKLHLNKLAGNTLQILEASYPHSPEAERLRA